VEGQQIAAMHHPVDLEVQQLEPVGYPVAGDEAGIPGQPVTPVEQAPEAPAADGIEDDNQDLAPLHRDPGRLAQQSRAVGGEGQRSEEHTSELQSRENLVCRLLLEKKKTRYRQ